MQSICIRVPRLRQYPSDHAFEVYGDLGGGGIDYDRPLTDRKQRLWPEAEPQPGHLLGGHLMVRHLDGIEPDGHLQGAHLGDRHLWPAVDVRFVTREYIFGRFQHEVRIVSGVGNMAPAGSVVHEQTINSSPPVPTSFKVTSYDSDNDQATFSFQPVRFSP